MNENLGLQGALHLKGHIGLLALHHLTVALLLFGQNFSKKHSFQHECPEKHKPLIHGPVDKVLVRRDQHDARWYKNMLLRRKYPLRLTLRGVKFRNYFLFQLIVFNNYSNNTRVSVIGENRYERKRGRVRQRVDAELSDIRTVAWKAHLTCHAFIFFSAGVVTSLPPSPLHNGSIKVRERFTSYLPHWLSNTLLNNPPYFSLSSHKEDNNKNFSTFKKNKK